MEETTFVKIPAEELPFLQAAKKYASLMHRLTGNQEGNAQSHFVEMVQTLNTLETDLEDSPELIEALKDPETWLFLGDQFLNTIQENRFDKQLNNLLSLNQISQGRTGRDL